PPMGACGECLDKIDSFETKNRRVVKITGEFWASITEGDGNFHMFEFLEREGAQVLMEPIATWVAYMMHQVKANGENRKAIDAPYRNPAWWELNKRYKNEM